MKNGVNYKSGTAVDFNGLIISNRGKTAYLYVVPDNNFESNGRYWASVPTSEEEREYLGNPTAMFNLVCSTNVLECAAIATKFVREFNANRKILKGYSQRPSGGKMWGDQFKVEEFKFKALTVEEIGGDSTVKQNRGNKTVRRVTPKETNITEEFVGRQVNTLLGNKVEVKTRIKIKDMVVANTAFYRTVEDVTNYVNDLVKYNIK